MNLKTKDYEFFYSPLLGLLPVIVVLVMEPFWGLNIALHYGILLAPIVLLRNYFHKEYSNQPIILYFIFFFALYQYVSSHVYIIPDGHKLEIFIFHGLMIASIASTFIFKKFLFGFFSENFSGKSKHMERNLKEFYLLLLVLLIYMSIHYLVYLHSAYYPTDINVKFHKIFDSICVSLLGILIVVEIFRVRKITKLFKQEDFWPIVNKDGLVIGKVAKSITLTPSNFAKEMHPVVHVHVIKGESILMFKDISQGKDKWTSTIDEHVLYGQTMDDTIKRVAADSFNEKNFNPSFLLKHLQEKENAKNYVLLYYLITDRDIKLSDYVTGQIKHWPFWQIEENLGKGVFEDSFEIEYSYIKNTVLVAENFLKKN